MESRNSCEENEVLDFDISNWPSPKEKKTFTLKLESMIDGSMEEKSRSRRRNMIRLEKAQGRQDIVNLSIHFSCCKDILQLEGITSLINNSNRKWNSFSMTGINEVGNMYSSKEFPEEIKLLFEALKHVKALKLSSCNLNIGHGLELILEKIQLFTCLEELRLEGWQIDRISATTLIECLKCHADKSIRLLSMRSCRFLGENSFDIFCRGLKYVERLYTLDMSNCNLNDNDVIPLISSITRHPRIECVDLEKNCCQTQSSLDTIASWIKDDNCKLRVLNVRGLWTGFSEEGLFQRFVDTTPLFLALSHNTSLYDLNLSENCLENEEVKRFTSLLRNSSTKLCYIDVGMNPFNENGAKSLLQLVRDLKTIQHVKFENSFMEYECARLIEIQAEINYLDAFIGKSLDIPLSLWPHIFARIQCGTRTGKFNRLSKLSSDHIYRLLRAGTGAYGKQLSLRIATHNTKV